MDDPVPSEPAALQMVTTGGGTITVYGTPVQQNQSGSGCPRPYKGYVNYTNNGSGFWVVVRQSPASAQNSDPGPQPHHDAKIQYGGYDALDNDCDPNNAITILANSTSPMPVGSVTVPPSATPSSRYWFTLYFKTLPLPTGQYPLILNNFQTQ